MSYTMSVRKKGFRTAGSGAGFTQRPATFSLVRGSAACQRAFILALVRS